MWKADTGRQALRPWRDDQTYPVMCVSFCNKTSGLLLSGSCNGIIAMSDLGQGALAALRRTFEGHTSAVCSISLSPDDRYMASAVLTRLFCCEM